MPAETLDLTVRLLLFWRQKHGLSQAQTVTFFRAHLFDLTLSRLRSWESGRTGPRPNTREILERFLTEHPTPNKEGISKE
jgi:DNA-binding transcriptional regulator YiaG